MPVNKKLTGLLKLAILVALIVAGNLLTQGFVEGLDIDIRPSNEAMLHRIILTSVAAYVVLLAIPFVPGIEIGLALMMIFGPKIVPLVYGATLLSLSLGFLVGRYIPEPAVARFLHDLHLFRAAAFLEKLHGLDSRQRLQRMIQQSPRRLVPMLLRHRHLALLVAINFPGNVVIGGGGGLALAAGMSHLFSPLRFVLLVALAISPVPLLLLVFGERLTSWPI
ncbi:hypothetical protein [Marinobacter sp. X15-166B]|uniref:hypothetical protein n=1 Tax=Marinobacter sp. X15-166B TaxID=1897620 RepID=UPI00085CD0DF|nr:hypothetical protein [Marinobacter sp. X15-166B]OEY65911.1 hypothetical protein BG841_05210 [Marinobacter sp. X15-166B]